MDAAKTNQAHTREPEPKLYVNVSRSTNKGVSRLEAHDCVHYNRQRAIDEAEEWHGTYAFTLTDIGKIDLRPEFSEEYHAQVAKEQEVDRRIDEMQEGRAA
jgi:hypothetical protein